jgi:hypothetical protein
VGREEEIDGIPCVNLRIENPDPVMQERQLHPVPPEVAERLAQAGRRPRDSFKSRWEWKSLWVSLADFSLRRLAERTSFDSHVSESTITWRPVFDGAIEAARFHFSPPGPG